MGEYFAFESKPTEFTVVKPNTIRYLAGPVTLNLENKNIYTIIISGYLDKKTNKEEVSLIISEDSQKTCVK